MKQKDPTDINITKKNKADKQRGASLFEQAIVVALVGVTALAAVSLVGDKTKTKLNEIGNAVEGSESSEGGGGSPSDAPTDAPSEMPT